MKTLDYFENRAWVDEATGCWNWKQGRFSNGYGAFSECGRTRKAHRGAWEAVNGPIPEGMLICHHCDNPQCVNPEHLFLGTGADNMNDKVRKGRANAPRGSQHHKSKLTEHDVSIIKMLLDLGVQGQRLATLYDAHKMTISNIKTGRRWTHVAPLVQPAVAEVTR